MTPRPDDLTPDDSMWAFVTPKTPGQWVAALLAVILLLSLTFGGANWCSLRITSTPETTTTTSVVHA